MTKTRARQCGTKKPHASREAALGHRARLIRRGASPVTLNAYQCRHCAHWHVGHIMRKR